MRPTTIGVIEGRVFGSGILVGVLDQTGHPTPNGLTIIARSIHR